MEEQIQTIPPVAEPVEAQTSKPILKYAIFGILGILGVLGILYAGIAIGKKQVSSNTQLTTVPTVTPEHASDPTADWKTYTNQKYKFSVKYPQEFQVSEFPGQYDDTFSINITNQQAQRETETYLEEMEISVIVGNQNFKRKDFYYGGYEWTKSVVDTLQNVSNGASENHKYDVMVKIEDIDINGFTGVKYKTFPRPEIETEGRSMINVALIKNGATFFINGYAGNDSLVFSKPFSELFDQILSTFKFLDQKE
jgi:hypothetical protein